MFKNFIKWNMLLLCSLIVALFTMTEARASANEEIYVGSTYSSGGYYTPYYSGNYAISEMLITKNELGGDGAPFMLNNMAMLIYSTTNGSATASMNDVTIFVKHTTDSVLSTPGACDTTTYTKVWGKSNVPVGVSADVRNTWRIFDFTTPFEYNGTDNLLILFTRTNGSTSPYISYYATYSYYYGTKGRYATGTTFPTSFTTVNSYIPFTCFNKANANTEIQTPFLSKVSKYLYAVKYPAGTSTGSTMSDLYMLNANAALETIYTNEELGNEPRLITHISFYTYSRTGTVGTQSNLFRIYLKNTNISSVATGQSVDSITGYTKVFEGQYDIDNRGGAQWIQLELTTPFLYDGQSNLMMLAGTNTGASSGNYYTFVGYYSYANSAYRTRYVTTNGANWTSANSYTPNTRFTYQRDETVCGPNDEGIPTAAIGGIEYLLYSYYSYSRSDQIYTKTELGGAKTLTGLSLWYINAYDYDEEAVNNVSVLIKHTNKNAFANSGDYLNDAAPQNRDVAYYLSQGYTLVADSITIDVDVTKNNFWYDINFDSEFDYDGKSNISVAFVNNDGSWSGNYRYRFGYYSLPSNTNQAIFAYTDSWTSSDTYNTISDGKPYMKFYSYSMSQRYVGSEAYQLKELVGAGAVRQAIIGVNIKANNVNEPVNELRKMIFDGKYSIDRGQITRARVYYTSDDSTFVPSQQFGSDIVVTSTNIHNLEFNGSMPLNGTNNYFWLTYDIAHDCPNNDSMDAKIINFTLHKEGVLSTNIPDNTDPAGCRTILQPLSKGIYKVGSSEDCDYTRLFECAKEFSQVGVTKNTEIWIMNSLVEDSTCVFGPSPFGDDIVITLRPAPDSVVTITQKTAKIPLLVVNGCRNFQIEGSNAEVLGTGNDRSLTLSSKDVTIAYKNTGYGEIRNLNITGDVGISAFEVESSSNITIANNVVLRSLFGLYCQNSSDLVIYGNFIGDGGDANAVSNGFCLNNSRNVVATNNIFSNIGIKADTANGIIITSNTPLYDANIKFHSNVFNGITAVVEAYGINAKNVSNVEFLHNTIYMTSNAYTGKDPDLVAVMYDKGGNHINSNNNIFCNTVPSSTTTLILTSDMSNNPFNNVDNNVYKSSFVFRTDGTSSQSFSDWQAFMANNGAGKNDANSKLFEGTLNTISKSDYHLDGEAAGSSLLLVPINSLITTDIDGDDRTAFDGQLTFAGADQPVMDYVETDTQLPSSLAICEDSDESELTLTMRKDFVKWVDAARSYIPAVQNTWVRTAFDAPAVFDTLNYDTQDFYVEDPSIYSANPPYTKSGNYRVYSELGYYKFASNNCNVAITKLLTIASEPPADTTACSDASSISVSATLDGSYTALQWEKQNGSNWQNISGQTTATLTLNYTDATQVIGDYRLKVTTPGLCNAPGVIYSEVSHIGVGYPINAANITINQPEENLMTICDGTELIFNVTANGTILSYQWQRYDSATADFIDIPAVVYPSAVTSQFRIPSALAKDAGAYRCRVIGLPSCVGTADVSDTITINITETARILEQPQELIMCYDDVVDDALPVKAYFAASVSGENIAYQWYKDGKAISGADSSVFVFNTLTYKDAGNYQLEIGYSDCKGEPALQYTDAVNLYVYGETEIVTQTNDIYGFAGGYAILNVQAQTKGTQEKVESYQWYRNNIELQDDARFKGTKSSTLVINYLQPQDFNDQTASDYYYCVVQGICNADTSKGARIKPVPEIIIVTQPSSQDKCAGEKAVFEVDASATEVGEPITYQWYKGDGATFTPLADDARITGSNTATLTIDMLELSDADQYYVDVRYVNLSAGISSDKVTLSIEGAPVITKQPVGGKIDLGNTITLSVEIEEQYPGYVCDYQWYKDGSEIFNSNETSITVGNDGIDDAGKYYVIIKSMKGCGETKSNEVTVEVDAGAIVAQGNSFNIISVLPNPLANNATLRYSLEKSGMVSVSIVNIAGATVATLHNGMASSGVNDLEFSVNNLSNGTYYLQLEYNGNKLIHSIIITK